MKLDIKGDLLDRVAATEIRSEPFAHLYLEDILPDSFYDALHERVISYGKSSNLRPRTQDSKEFTNRRFSLVGSKDLEIVTLRAAMADTQVIGAFLEKFYLAPSDELIQRLSIHDEFECVFTEAGLTQDVHVDWPSKYLSFVMYFPEGELSREAEAGNGTILYDKELNPVRSARFRRNSMCVFAPHFYSYHGFSTTTDRPSVVMFYVDRLMTKDFLDRRGRSRLRPWRVRNFKHFISKKLARDPLREYGADPQVIRQHQRQCRINSRDGRIRDLSGMSLRNRLAA